ncbi:MAG: FAD-binding oxidoreductase [Bacteroidetes bacterium]|nr:FAD-binding oxidoreductase [Bacteroidota bacterium]
MDLKSGYPYFLLKNGLNQNYESLKNNCSTSVVILGGGISGALMAYALIKNGIECIVIDKRPIGFGSTSASTSLLQYEIDTPLHQLSKQIGHQEASQAYTLCSNAIDMLKEIAEEIGFVDFKYCSSLYFSHTKSKNNFLRNEFESRRDAGFDVRYLNEEEILKEFGFHSKEAIFSGKAAKTDAYLFTHFLHKYNRDRGAKIYESTNIKNIRHNKTGIEVTTDKGYVITAQKIIYATGYEAVKQVDRSIVKLKSTYACVSERLDTIPDALKQTIFWNTDDPYLYFREDDQRIIIGGRDENYYDPEKRDKLLHKKTERLKQDFVKLFPGIEFKIQFSWAGTFGSTKDGLPYIGAYDKKPNSYFALGFGGNGITFSALAADMITRHIKGERDCIPKMFSFDR